MLDLARKGRMRLFAGFVDETPASFLYCGEFRGFGFGWSQANVEEYAGERALRHLIEWSAVLSYQSRGFRYYEIGRRFYGPQLYKVPTPKELSISFFKERYGGQLWPYLVFEQFFDPDACRLVYEKRLREYLGSLRFDSQPLETWQVPPHPTLSHEGRGKEEAHLSPSPLMGEGKGGGEVLK
jgi:hypothetical protein